MRNFKDSSLKTGLFLLDLLDSLKRGCVDYELVARGATVDECMMNAKYAITVARKLGCCLFLLWEDIVEINPKVSLFNFFF